MENEVYGLVSYVLWREKTNTESRYFDDWISMSVVSKFAFDSDLEYFICFGICLAFYLDKYILVFLKLLNVAPVFMQEGL